MALERIGDPPAAPLQESYWPRDTSVPLVEHTIGALLAERARTHRDAPHSSRTASISASISAPDPRRRLRSAAA